MLVLLTYHFVSFFEIKLMTDMCGDTISKPEDPLHVIK